MVSEGQKPRCIFAGSFRSWSLTKLPVREWAKLESAEGSTEEKSVPKLTRVDLGRPQKVISKITEVNIGNLNFFLYLVGDTSVLPRGLSFRLLVTWKLASSRESEKDGRQPFYNLISELILYFCHIQFDRSCLYVQPTFKERGLHNSMNTRRQGSLEVSFEKTLRGKGINIAILSKVSYLKKYFIYFFF